MSAANAGSSSYLPNSGKEMNFPVRSAFFATEALLFIHAKVLAIVPYSTNRFIKSWKKVLQAKVLASISQEILEKS